MSRVRLEISILIVFMLMTPIVYGTPAADLLRDPYRIKVTGKSVPEGYWVYGSIELSSFSVGNEREIIVEVTLLNSTGGVIDVVTTLVTPTILAHGKTGSFIAKSTTKEEVAEIDYRVISSVDTDNVNYKYLEMSKIWPVDRGVTGWLENIHDAHYVIEAEVIALFLDVEGNPVDVQSYVMNYGDKYNPGEKKQWFCETEEEFDSYILNVQCNLASRERYLFLDFERPNNVNNTWTPPIGETFFLILRDQPHDGKTYVDVTITDPLGNSTVERFMRSGLEDYRFEITPTIPGVWNVTWVVEPFWVTGGSAYAEGAQMNRGFFTWDPNPEEDSATEAVTPTDSSSENTTKPIIAPPVDDNSVVNKTSPTASASEIIDSATSAAEDLVESLPEEVKNQIPGFSVVSVLLALVIFALVPRTKAYQI